MDTSPEIQKIKSPAPAARAATAAHVLGVISIVLLLVWLLHYREGIRLDSPNAFRIFNVHPFLMFFGFIFMAGEAMMAYKTTARAEKTAQKLGHALIHSIAIALGIVGLHAVFKFHDQLNIPNMYSLHSWIGIATFSIFCLQWLIGLAVFLLPGASAGTRVRAAPWHVSVGRVLLFMAISAALTGLIEKATFLKLRHNGEGRLVNFLALAILLFGISVDLSVSLAYNKL
ncbi:probable transmembrane ascorbate ferrireductase 3 [Andrographis paniculata]|uniref:probable transmembrane ascorbate ferrireductase 3 n=1 Tax=Andrographis paniculata TaxID=175694 RepID=UPI0021E752D2|nr:probable transmembrane ascorbate ferrireductase 3 [Andrographis paniculata]